MKKKNFTTEDNYKKNVLKRMIILCWILLGVCFAIKIFGGNFFGIISTNKTFINLCKFIDGSCLYYVLAFINYIVSGYIYTLAILGELKLKPIEYIIILISLSICFLSKFISLYLGLIFDFGIYFLVFCPIMCIQHKQGIKRSFLKALTGLILVNVFQLIGLFVKNLGIFKITNESSLIQMIFNIDYIIMLLLYMFYSFQINKKENNMGFWGFGWLKDEVEKLKALLAVTTDEEQKKVLTEVIENLEKKAK